MTVLICDDDTYTVDAIKNQMPWSQMGVEQVFCAFNGMEGKQIIDAFHPEIIICDIGMPLCNGIEVLKYVRSKNIPCEFVFLTCYESFEYAQDAIRYGVKSYITKPLDMAELEKELRSITQTVAAKRSADTLRQKDETALINYILRALRDGMYGASGQTLDRSLIMHNLPITAQDPFRCVLVFAEIYDALQNSNWTGDTLRYSCSYLAQEVISNRMDYKFCILDNQATTFQALLYIPGSVSSEDILKRCQRFCSILYAYTTVSPICIIGDVVPLSETPTQAETLQAKLETVRLRKGCTFALHDDVEHQPIIGSVLDEVQLLNFLKQQDKAGFLRLITDYINRAPSNQKDSGLQMTLLHHALLHAFYQCIRDNNLPPYSIFNDEAMRAAERNAERSSYDMIQFAGRLFDSVGIVLSQNVDKYNSLERAKQYIHDHFREEVDRDTVARIACLAPNYLSKVFHAGTGLSLREYVNKLRINEAKRLLLSTNKSISEIAGEVGFDNISYFSTVFRKQCGISPVDWKSGKQTAE